MTKTNTNKTHAHPRLSIQQNGIVALAGTTKPEAAARCARLRRNLHMIVVRKLTKVTLLAAYFGLFAMLVVAAGDFVLHG